MTPAIRLLDSHKIAYQLMRYKTGVAHGWSDKLLEALDLPEAQVFKTLVVSGHEPLIALVPARQSLDLKALATFISERSLEMADDKTAERATGYQLGGICPIATRKTMRVVIDDSAERYDAIFISGGRRGIEIGIGVADLARVTQAEFASISQP